MTREDANRKNLCTSCASTNCIFAYGVIRKQCEFYETDKEDEQSDGDTISRQAAIEALDIPDYENGEAYSQYVNDKRAIEQLPSAQPERQKGEWIEFTNTNHTYVCSVCGRMLVNITDGKNKVAKHYPFCHCGADMRGKQDE